MISTSFADLNPLPIFVAWRTEQRGTDLTKVPYEPGRKRGAKSDTPATWGTRASADEWAKALAPDAAGPWGAGLMLGTMGTEGAAGLALGRAGIDLDTCRDPETGIIEPWALAVIERFGSYTEVSPSGTGVKVFFTYDPEDLPALLDAMGTKGGKVFKRPGGKHPPAIELYLSGRFFALTGKALPDLPADLRQVDRATLLWLIREEGPAFAAKRQDTPQDAEEGDAGEAGQDSGAARDKSRSGAAFRVAVKAKRDGASYEEMRDALLDDPKSADWARTKGAANGEREIRRLWQRAVGRYGETDRNLPTVKLVAGQLPRIITQGEDALLKAGLGLYQRSKFIVKTGHVRIEVSHNRTADAQRILDVGDGALVEALSKAANWEAFNKKAEEWVSCDPPVQVARAYRDRVGHWRLPILAGVINAPTLRADGSLLATPGYDAQSGLLFDPCGATFPAILDKPSEQDARDALGKLVSLIDSFPFVGPLDRAVALSAMLTCTVRRSLPTAPMHAFTAPTAGSGKSMLVDLFSIMATGREAGVIGQGQTEEELEKRLGALLLAGETAIAIDNCEQPLGGEFIASMLTQPVVRARILGRSEAPELPANAFVTATGNNLTLKGDLTRRAILCRLDPKCERPELREFSRDPIQDAKDFRGEYVAAALTILRAYQVAGMPARQHPLGSFADWSRWVRDALVWLGEADPVETMNDLRAADPILENLNSVLSQWLAVLGANRPVSVKDMIEAATRTATGEWGRQDFINADFREALLVVAGAGGAINSRRLGTWLGATKDRRISIDGQNECSIKMHGTLHGNRLWKLETISKRALRVV